MRKRTKIILAIPLILLVYFGLTYIPHKAVSIDPLSISKITVFDGNTGNAIDITDPAEMDYIIENLNDITFQKGKPSFFRLGYSYRTTFYDKDGEKVDEMIIGSNDGLRYKGFFYTSKNDGIVYDYIEQLFNRPL